jgi:hypothetical protein
MLPSTRRISLLIVFIVGFASSARAQRSQYSLASIEWRRSATASSAWGSSSAKTSFSSVSLASNRSTVNKRSTNFDNEHRFANITGERNRETDLLTIQETSTPFATESRVAVAPLLGARLQLNISVTTVRNGNVMLGPIPASETLHAPPQSRSADLYGFGVSIPLGWGAQVQTSKNLLRSAARVMRGD